MTAQQWYNQYCAKQIDVKKFLYEMRRDQALKSYISPVNSAEDVISILKNRGVISEFADYANSDGEEELAMDDPKAGDFGSTETPVKEAGNDERKKKSELEDFLKDEGIIGYTNRIHDIMMGRDDEFKPDDIEDFLKDPDGDGTGIFGSIYPKTIKSIYGIHEESVQEEGNIDAITKKTAEVLLKQLYGGNIDKAIKSVSDQIKRFKDGQDHESGSYNLDNYNKILAYFNSKKGSTEPVKADPSMFSSNESDNVGHNTKAEAAAILKQFKGDLNKAVESVSKQIELLSAHAEDDLTKRWVQELAKVLEFLKSKQGTDEPVKANADTFSMNEAKVTPKLTADQVNYYEFTRGWRQELENTDDIDKAKEIALKNLAKDPAYYSKLLAYDEKKRKDQQVKNNELLKFKGDHASKKDPQKKTPKFKVMEIKNEIREIIKGFIREAGDYQRNFDMMKAMQQMSPEELADKISQAGTAIGPEHKRAAAEILGKAIADGNTSPKVKDVFHKLSDTMQEKLSDANVNKGGMHKMLGVKSGENIASKYKDGASLYNALMSRVHDHGKVMKMLNYAANIHSGNDIFDKAVSHGKGMNDKKKVDEWGNKREDPDKVVHNEKCTMAYGKPSPEGVCPRCDQLRGGDKPRKGWNADKQAREKRNADHMKQHFAPGGKHDQITKNGGIDTAFQW